MKLDMPYFLDYIKDIPYVLTKIKVPYVPNDFPVSYAVGKDLDILVTKENFQEMKEKVIRYAGRYKKDFKIGKVNDTNGFRLRFMEKKLHFQLDISYKVKGISDNSIIRKSIKNRKQIKNYYVALDKYEIIYRYYFYRGKKNKQYHLDYVWEHINDIDNNLLKKAGINIEDIYRGRK